MRKQIFVQSTAPLSAEVGDIWVDTSFLTPVIKVCSAVPSTFISVGGCSDTMAIAYAIALG